MLNISGNVTMERILTVGGFDVPTMVNMLEDVIAGLKRTLTELGYGETNTIGMLLDESEVEYVTSIDDYQLNQILEESSTHIDVFLMCCPHSSERVIRIRGEPGCIASCVASLYQLLEWCPAPANRCPYNADNANEEYAADYGGYTNFDDLTEQAMDISSEDLKVDETKDIGAKMTTWSSSSVNPDSKIAADDPTASVTSKVSIPSHLAGVILGKGGSRLNQIRHESLASIKIDSEIHAEERVVTIAGTAESVENAKELLRMCIRHLCVRVG